MKPIDFIAKIANHAKEDMKTSKILASLTVAQAILESNWGESGLTVKGNNLFGMKARVNQPYGLYDTREYVNQKWITIQAKFRHYKSWGESIADHSRLLSTAKRYKNLVGEKDYRKAVREIYAAGYATDPLYPSKLLSLIERYELYKLDREEPEMKKEDADKIIQYLKMAWAVAGEDERKEIGQLADSLRVASGQPKQNS